MTDTLTLAPEGNGIWVQWPQEEPSPEVLRRCDANHIRAAIEHLGKVEAVSSTVNTSGEKEAPLPAFAAPSAVSMGGTVVSNLPPFCEVIVDLRGERHVAKITVWVPLTWNGRFMGVFGGGNRTSNGIGLPEFLRSASLPIALRNGFAAAETDGGNRDERFVEWGLDRETGGIDWELTDNWVHRSTHDMAVIGKAVTEAIHGRAPVYSYASGCSGGGRQAIVEAQRYPEDFDGIWAADPAINWTRFIPAEMWPALVMKEEGTVLPPAKFEAFRAAAVEALDGVDGLRDGMIGAFDPLDYDARTLIGAETEAGPITEADARVMTMIWQGPRTRDGAFLWHGIRPGAESWGSNFAGTGLAVVAEKDGVLEPVPFAIAEGYMRAWLAVDAGWDWHDLTYERYEQLFRRSTDELAALGSDDPDLAAFKARGGKLILSHGACDQVIPAAGSVDFYGRVVKTVGSLDATRAFARLFVSDGDGHGLFLDPGPGMATADGMIALMRWVEEGVAPDMIVGTTLDLATGAVKARRPIYAYPFVTRYAGSGDPAVAESYRAERLTAADA